MALVILCVAFAGMVLTNVASAQAKGSTNEAQTSSTNDRLAKKLEWGSLDLRLFHDVDAKLVFTLATSWIPGEDRKGRFRYKVDATAGFEDGTTATLDSAEKVLNRAFGCDLYLRLQDSDDFELRSIPLAFNRTVNSSMMLVGLTSNSSVPMSATEYRSFVGTTRTSGTWTITWNCHDAPEK